MNASKKNKVIREGDPLFEKLKSQMRPDIAEGLKSITLIKCKKESTKNDKRHIGRRRPMPEMRAAAMRTLRRQADAGASAAMG
jgi:hypothetical protein